MLEPRRAQVERDQAGGIDLGMDAATRLGRERLPIRGIDFPSAVQHGAPAGGSLPRDRSLRRAGVGGGQGEGFCQTINAAVHRDSHRFAERSIQ